MLNTVFINDKIEDEEYEHLQDDEQLSSHTRMARDVDVNINSEPQKTVDLAETTSPLTTAIGNLGLTENWGSETAKMVTAEIAALNPYSI